MLRSSSWSTNAVGLTGLLCPLSHTRAWCADVNSMVSLISGWLGNALASGAAAEKPVEDAETTGGLSEVLADILANLQATFAGQPLDVEISYEPGSKVSAFALFYLCWVSWFDIVWQIHEATSSRNEPLLITIRHMQAEEPDFAD